MVLLATVVTEEFPFVIDERYVVTDVGGGVFRVLLKFGFLEEPRIHEAIRSVIEQIAPHMKETDITYVLGHERFVVGAGGRMGRLAESIFAFLYRNARNPSDFYGLPPNQVIELGARIDL